MKKILFILFTLTISAQAQVSNYDYLYFCDKLIVDINNSVPYLQVFYADLKEFKKKIQFSISLF